MKASRFEDLDIWKEARTLSKAIFDLTQRPFFDKDYRFSSQIKSASGSVMDNIAEGFERNGNKEFLQFLSIAKGSCGEARSQCYRAFDYNYINQTELDTLLGKTTALSRKIAAFMAFLKTSDLKGSKYN